MSCLVCVCVYIYICVCVCVLDLTCQSAILLLNLLIIVRYFDRQEIKTLTDITNYNLIQLQHAYVYGP
jgi:hypothetical protein